MNKQTVIDVLSTDENPMFSRISICQKIVKDRWDSHHLLYGKVGRIITALEKEGLVFAYRHTNQGTTYILKSRVRNDDIPF